jgi:hypothetical protein
MRALPPEIVPHILSFAHKSTLRTCMLVNHEWYNLVQKELLTILEFSKQTFEIFIAETSSRVNADTHFHRYIKSFNLLSADTDDGTSATHIATLLPTFLRLEELSLPYPIWDRLSDLTSKLAPCRNLHTVTCIPSAIKVLADLYGHQLRSMTVSSQPGLFIGDKSTVLNIVTEIPSLFPNLVYLRISLRKQILNEEFLESIARNCQTLSTIHLEDCSVLPIRCKETSEMTMSSLSSLTITFSYLDPSWLAYIAQRYPNLRKLHLTITLGRDRQRYSLSQWQDSFEEIANRCINLQELYCQSPSNGYALYPTKVFFDTFSQTANQFFGLTSLTLCQAAGFTDQDILSVAICAGKTLVNLELSQCLSITLTGLKAALARCFAMIVLSLSDNDFAPSLLLLCCPSIKSLKLQRTTIIQETNDSESYQRILLKKVYLNHVRMAHVFFNAISKYAPNLCDISITDDSNCVPMDYGIYLPNNIVYNLDITWMLGPYVNDKDPFYFKLSQTSVTGRQPTVCWCIRSGEPHGIFYMVAPGAIPPDAIYFDMTLQTIHRLDFQPIQPTKSVPSRPPRHIGAHPNSEAGQLYFPAPIPLQSHLQLPIKRFEQIIPSKHMDNSIKKNISGPSRTFKTLLISNSRS